ncbi:hypothetical protein [Streptomyces griseosporeus]|uniref:hypothetical protein n=1 Tax=Streptomyces griseosporeus TaxID=1910 RepID=UPI00369D8DE4
MSSHSLDKVADGIAYVCEHLVEIRFRLARVGGASILECFLEELRAGNDVSARLDDIHFALQAGGDQLGLYGLTAGSGPGRSAGGSRSQRFGLPVPAEPVYLCPGRTCNRWWLPDERAVPPICEVYCQKLRKDRL